VSGLESPRFLQFLENLSICQQTDSQVLSFDVLTKGGSHRYNRTRMEWSAGRRRLLSCGCVEKRNLRDIYPYRGFRFSNRAKIGKTPEPALHDVSFGPLAGFLANRAFWGSKCRQRRQSGTQVTALRLILIVHFVQSMSFSFSADRLGIDLCQTNWIALPSAHGAS
jgi:hypothetical protein